mmetsp:Transcript_2635/g.10719  ORF Transcript_2635/g.10719 Transcript_2635/m.10719 type:complete len:271 (+) Transcript_2635:1190-2002(+)
MVRQRHHAQAPAASPQRHAHEDDPPRPRRRVRRLGRVRGPSVASPPARRPRRPQDDPQDGVSRVRSMGARGWRGAEESRGDGAPRESAVEAKDARRVQRVESFRGDTTPRPRRRHARRRSRRAPDGAPRVHIVGPQRRRVDSQKDCGAASAGEDAPPGAGGLLLRLAQLRGGREGRVVPRRPRRRFEASRREAASRGVSPRVGGARGGRRTPTGRGGRRGGTRDARGPRGARQGSTHAARRGRFWGVARHAAGRGPGQAPRGRGRGSDGD